MVTLVFTDLVNSTAIKSHLPGPNITSRNRSYYETILYPHRRRVEERLAFFGGRVVETEGDGHFLVFDDAMQAACWAAELQSNYATDPIFTPLGPLQVKIGMHTGSPLPDSGGRFVGQEIDYAARVAALSQGGQIVLSEASAVLVRDARISGLRIYAHGERELKGIGRVPVFELLDADKQPTPLKDAALSSTNLPNPPAFFIGREDLLTQVRQRLVAGGVTVLQGSGGMGKTTLALAAAHGAHNDGELPGGVAWLNCELKLEWEEYLRQIANVFFGDRMETQHIGTCNGRVMKHLRDCHALVVLDNFETVSGDHAVLRWLSEVQPPASVLITTREMPAGLRGQVIPVYELSRGDAKSLLIERASEGSGREQIEKQIAACPDKQIIDHLCAAVGDHPLAIELLASRATRSPLQRLLDRVRRELTVLESADDPNRPHRHHSVQLCIAFSFDTLTAEARDLFLHMSVFPGCLGMDTLSAVMGTEEWDRWAEELVAGSLWRIQGAGYTLHPLIRQFALEKLQAERPRYELHAARTVIGLAREKTLPLFSGEGDALAAASALEWMEGEWSNLLAAADFACAADDGKTLAQLCGCLREFFQVRGHWSECEHLYRRNLALLQKQVDRKGEADTLHDLGILLRRQERWADAEQCYQRCLTIRRELGDRSGEGQILNYLGEIYQVQKRWPETEAILQQSLGLCRESGNRIGEKATLHNLGDSYLQRALWPDAEDCYRQSFAICREIGDRRGMSLNLLNLGLTLQAQARSAEAEESYQQSLEICEELGDRYHEGETLKNYAQLWAAQGNLPEALKVGRKAIASLSATEDSRLLSEVRQMVSDWGEQIRAQALV